MPDSTGPLLLETRRLSATAVELDLEIPPDLVHFRGHFPGLPILPGVLQVDWAVSLAQDHLQGIEPARFRGLSALKFMRLIRPGRRLALELRFDPARHELSFRYGDAAGDYSCGRVGFA